MSALSISRIGKPTFKELHSIASSARSKLEKEAERSEHKLRFLVAHANFLDGLVEDLACAKLERSKDSRKADASNDGKVSWVGIVQDPYLDEDDESDSCSDDEYWDEIDTSQALEDENVGVILPAPEVSKAPPIVVKAVAKEPRPDIRRRSDYDGGRRYQHRLDTIHESEDEPVYQLPVVLAKLRPQVVASALKLKTKTMVSSVAIGICAPLTPHGHSRPLVPAVF